MIPADAFCAQLAQSGFGLVTGVPCSYLTPLINAAAQARDVRYVGAANEGDAVAIACGAQLGGVRGVAMFQNSGLGNAVNPLTSLTSAFALPVLLMCSWRGRPGGRPDEPQHDVMGRITTGLFDLMGIPHETLGDDAGRVPELLARATAEMDRTGAPYALIADKDDFTGDGSTPGPRKDRAARVAPEPPAGGDRIDPDDALRAIRGAARETDVLLATTGFTGRALYELGDHPSQLYMVGSMGCVSSLGLGLAIARPERRVIVLDGDGSLLMRMGALATIGAEAPPNLVHVLLDNGVHDSTGAQATVSPLVDLSGVARACGYARAANVESVEALAAALGRREPGPSFVRVRTLPRPDRKLPRPDMTPPDVARRLRAWLDRAG